MDRCCEAVTTFLRTYLPLKSIMFIRALFGVYFDIGPHKILSFLARVYCFASTLTIAGVILYNPFGLWSLPSILEFIFINITSIITGERHFNDFCNNIANFDKTTDIKSNSMLSGLFYVILFTSAVLRINLNYFIHNFHPSTAYLFCVVFITESINLGRVPRNIVFDSLYQRMKCLRESFENVFATNETMVPRDAAYKAIKVKSYLKLYKKLMDSLQHIDIYIQVTLSLSLAVSITKAMEATYGFMYLVRQESKMLFTFSALETGFSIALVCLPALFSELISNEIEKIMIIITRQQIIYSDKALLSALRSGRLYLRTRPFRFSLGRAVPVDSSLPAAVFSICFTYMFIIVQFSNS